MAYIGKQPTVGNFVKLDAITTSATATYNLTNGGVAYSPQSANHCLVSLNGVIQEPTSASNVGGFTISGSTIVFTSALTSADVIDFILVLGDVLNIGTPSDGTVGFAKVTSNLITGATAETTIAGGDLVLIYDDSASALRKMTRTNFVSGLSVANTPAFLAYRSSSNQSISNQTETQCQFQTELFDTNSNYSTSTYRFTPTTAGKYFLFAMLQLTGTINAGAYFGSIRKNGSYASLAEVYVSTSTSMSYSLAPHCIVEANGSSDYFDCTIYYAGSASLRLGVEFSQFGGYKLIGV